tara:strand:- start:687 stop:947 length:261 start_codon:yes stop_codon:yes gene_type:complete
MKKIIVHKHNSVSEYFLDDKKQIIEVKYLSDNRTKDYIYDKENPVYDSLINLFSNDDLTFKETDSKRRTINEYRQNKDNIYSYRYN